MSPSSIAPAWPWPRLVRCFGYASGLLVCSLCLGTATTARTGSTYPLPELDRGQARSSLQIAPCRTAENLQANLAP